MQVREPLPSRMTARLGEGRRRLHSRRDVRGTPRRSRRVHHHRRAGRRRQDDAGRATRGRTSRRAGCGVHLTREPGGTWLGERIRDVLLARTGSTAPTDPLTDALLFNAARRQLVREVIRPALEAGTTVVCARFADSTLAYQGYGAGRAARATARPRGRRDRRPRART